MSIEEKVKKLWKIILFNQICFIDTVRTQPSGLKFNKFSISFCDILYTASMKTNSENFKEIVKMERT